MQNLDIPLPISTRKRKIVSTTPDFKRNLSRFEASARMSTDNVDLIGPVNKNGEQNLEEDKGAKEADGGSGETSKPKETTEMETEEGAGKSDGNESQSVPPVTETTGMGDALDKREATRGKKTVENGEGISDTAAKLILKKFDEASKERNAISSSVEEKIMELKNDVKEVEKRTEMVSVMKEDLKKVQDGMVSINERVTSLENSERNMIEEMKKHFNKMRDEEMKTKKLKEKILAEIAEEKNPAS